jgi:hypothetical protein
LPGAGRGEESFPSPRGAVSPFSDSWSSPSLRPQRLYFWSCRLQRFQVHDRDIEASSQTVTRFSNSFGAAALDGPERMRMATVSVRRRIYHPIPTSVMDQRRRVVSRQPPVLLFCRGRQQTLHMLFKASSGVIYFSIAVGHLCILSDAALPEFVSNSFPKTHKQYLPRPFFPVLSHCHSRGPVSVHALCSLMEDPLPLPSSPPEASRQLVKRKAFMASALAPSAKKTEPPTL